MGLTVNFLSIIHSIYYFKMYIRFDHFLSHIFYIINLINITIDSKNTKNRNKLTLTHFQKTNIKKMFNILNI